MNKNLIKFFIYMLVLTLPFALLAKGGDGKKQLRKTVGSPISTRFNINNVSTWIYNNGSSDIQPNGNSGFIFPKFSNKAPFFQSGFVWGGKLDGAISVSGSAYRQGTRPGRIVSPGHAQPESDPDVRIYRVRRDITGYADPVKMRSKVKAEVRDEGGTATDVVNQYQADWNEWPASQGAPYEDVDKNGSYDPTKDIPGFVGADQTVWFVNNDLDATTMDYMYGSLPQGIEQQVTIWGYNKAGDLGNMLFRKYIIINKNAQQKPITDMYVTMWSDPDNGDAGDDYVGMDTTLSLQYIYNATTNDATYGSNPPAAGFDFFQGPRIKTNAPSDTAIFKGKKWAGYKNLPATGSYYFVNGGTSDYLDPNQGLSSGSLQFYNLMQGKTRNGNYFPVPTQVTPRSENETNFPLSGDPVTGTGYLDGIINQPGDRRMGMASGPFTLAYGDTQEVVVAQICAGGRAGISNIRAITLLRAADKEAQKAFNNFFPKPTPFLNPFVEVINLDRQVVLNWGSDVAAASTTENYADEFYQFQGYEVFQLATEGSSIEDPSTVRIGTYDIADGKTSIIYGDIDPVSSDVISKVYHYGTDFGLKRQILLKKNYLTNENLNNGSRYYYAVRAYATTDSSFIEQQSITTTLDVLTAVPQTPDPGVTYGIAAGTVINASQTKGSSDGAVEVTVVDPNNTTGHAYKATFESDSQSGELLWNLIDDTAKKTILAKQSLVEDESGQITDGIVLKVVSPPVEINTWAFSGGTRWFTGVNWGGLQMGGGLDVGVNFFGSNLAADQYKKIEIRFKTTATGQKAYRYLRGATPNYAYQDYTPQHFEVWDVTSSPAVQLAVAYVEQKGVAEANSLWKPTSSTADREYLFIFSTPYTAEPQTAYTSVQIFQAAANLPIMYAWWPLLRSTSYTFNPQDGQILTITPNFSIAPGHEFSFSVPAKSVSADQAKADVEKVNVFPNPYYGVNSQEINKYQRFVTFNHLPKLATIRIFNLAGQLVRTIDKNADSQYQRWDLKNFDNLPVASGLYVVQVDMPAEGVKKTLKLIVIQETQVLDKF